MLMAFPAALSVCLSFFLVAFGQPAWSDSFSLMAAAVGYALFWYGALQFPRGHFWLGMVWFGAVQAVHLSWLTSTEYMGPLILAVYVFLLVAIGIQFGLLTRLVQLPLRVPQILGIAGFWVLMEWIRIFPCTGFTWSSVGLSLAANPFSIQFASLFGIYGLSFWVIVTNLLALRAILVRNKQTAAVWAVCALLPYAFGAGHQWIWEQKLGPGKELSVALVQTALLPEQKEFVWSKEFIPPAIQWDRILSYLGSEDLSQVDLIVLPEGAVPGGVRRCCYRYEVVQAIWESHFGAGASVDFPPLVSPYAEKGPRGNWEVSNAFWLQSLANRFGAEVIAGLEDAEPHARYNAAFHIQPRKSEIDRYEKRVLVPIGEYVPLRRWKILSQWIDRQFEIHDSFDAGLKAHVFQGVIPIGIAICMEEAYSHLVREIRLAGAELFVSISNDAWFPASRLARQHYDHGMIRANENGVCLLRACNTGVTAAIDCFGKPIEQLPISDQIGGVLSLKMPIRSYPTLYLFWGDLAILLLSGFFLVFCLFHRKKEEKVALI